MPHMVSQLVNRLNEYQSASADTAKLACHFAAASLIYIVAE